MSLTDGALRPTSDRTVARVEDTKSVSSPAAPRPVFTTDAPTDSEASVHHVQGRFFAELLTHRLASTPLTLGLFGPAGSGKSSTLRAVMDSVEALSTAVPGAGETAFLDGVTAVRTNLQPGTPVALSLMDQVASALSPAFPRLVAEASHAGLDPRAAAQDTANRLNELRHQLDVERGKLDELATRYARLTETVLFEGGGSQIDGYARRNRARIERSLRRFGFDPDDGTAYRELVRDAHDTSSPLARGPGWLRAFWAYRGQTRLLVIAAVFFLMSWAVGLAIANQETLVDAVRSSSDKMGSAADWLAAHAHWLHPIKDVCALAGVAVLALNVLRGFRFLQPVVKGSKLLRDDLAARRRSLDGLLAHQTQRVDALARDVEAANQAAAEAERRLAAQGMDGQGPRQAARRPEPSPDTAAFATASAFFGAISDAISARAQDRLASSGSAAPARLAIGLDGFEDLSAGAAADALAMAHALLNRPGIVTIVAIDRDHLVSGLGPTDPAFAAARLDRMVQVPYSVGASEEPWPASQAFVRALVSGGEPVQASAVEAIDPSRSVLDMPWLQSEGAVLEALAPFAGTTPRAAKRFVNLYRIARADPRMRGGTAQDLAALAFELAIRQPAGMMPGPDPTTEAARRAVVSVVGPSFDPKPTGRGMATARLYNGL